MNYFRYIVSSESGNIIIWNRPTEQVLFKELQPGIEQLSFLEDGTKVIAISKPIPPPGADIPAKTTATGIVRTIPSGNYFIILLSKGKDDIGFKEAMLQQMFAKVTLFGVLLQCRPERLDWSNFKRSFHYYFITGARLFTFDYPVRNITGVGFKEGIVTSDFQNIVVLAADKGHHREALHIFNAKTGAMVCKLPLKQAGVKVSGRFRQETIHIYYKKQ